MRLSSKNKGLLPVRSMGWRPRTMTALPLIAAMACLTGMTPASAQSSRAGANALPEIMVTARFRQENLQQTPIAITAFSGQMLEQKSFENVDDIGKGIPNAFIQPSHAAWGGSPVIRLRGIGQIESLFAFEPGVGVYIDDVYHSTMLGSDMDLMDLDQVEVLRGPQGTLFGKNSLGGAIVLRSKKPMGDNSGYVQATYGSYNKLEFNGGLDVSLIENKLFMRIAATSKTQDGYQDILDFACQMQQNGTPQLAGIGDGLGADGSAGGGLDGAPDVVPVGSAADNNFAFPSLEKGARNNQKKPCKIGTYGGKDLQGGRVMLRYIATPDLEFNVTAHYTDDHSQESPLSARSITTARLGTWNTVKVYNAFGIQMDDRFLIDNPYETYYVNTNPFTGQNWPNADFMKSYGVSATADYNITDDIHFKVIGAYEGYKGEQTANRFAVPFPLNLVYNDTSLDQYSVEARFTGNLLDNKLEWTLGGFFFTSDSYAGGTVILDATNWAGVLPPFDQNDRFSSDNRSVFLHTVFHATDRLSLTGGIRYTHESKQYLFDHPPFLPGAGQPPIPANTSINRVDWKVDADYRLTDDLFVYGQVATGFRSPGFNPRPFNATQLIPFDNESLTSYEVGFKGDMFERRLRLNVAAFYSDYGKWVRNAQGIQCTPPNVPSNPVLSNICPAGTPLAGTPGIPWSVFISSSGKIYGLELEFTADLTEGLTVDGAFGLNRERGDQKDPTALDYIDPHVKTSPEVNANLGVQYRADLGDMGSLTPRLDWFYMGEQTFGAVNRAPAPDEYISAYSTFNARVTYQPESADWQLSAAVTNLTNKFYWLGFVGSLPQNGGGQTGRPSEPREWSITFKKNF